MYLKNSRLITNFHSQPFSKISQPKNTIVKVQSVLVQSVLVQTKIIPNQTEGGICNSLSCKKYFLKIVPLQSK